MSKIFRYTTIVILATIAIIVIVSISLWFWLDPVNRDSPISLAGDNVYVDCDICKTEDDGSLHLVIPDDVCNYMHDENYIIAYQRPSFVRADYFWTFDNTVDKDSIKNLKELSYRLKDCYWIIVVRNDSVLGPLDKKTFDYNCSVLGVKIIMQND